MVDRAQLFGFLELQQFLVGRVDFLKLLPFAAKVWMVFASFLSERSMDLIGAGGRRDAKNLAEFVFHLRIQWHTESLAPRHAAMLRRILTY